MSIIIGDCLDAMKEMESNSISAVVTDPPYGLKFMGKEWDHGVPGIPFWEETLRVCKPGSFLLAFGGTRTYHRLTCAIEDAGWEIRDCIQWIYGSGFPKSHNHFGIEGYGTALKPAYEPIIMAMKACDGTFKQNAKKLGQAGINIDDCRIKTLDNISGISSKTSIWGDGNSKQIISDGNKKGGRWPSNVILDEVAGKKLDEQSGTLKSGELKPCKRNGKNPYSGGFGDPNGYFNSSSGGASRFFYCAKASPSERNKGCNDLEDKIGGGLCSTVSGDSRTCHISRQKNNHPTVKPLKLMKYLITLVMPPKDGILLDPFAGSGSTIMAAKDLGHNAIGIEKEEAYAEIARSRIASVAESFKFYKR